MKMRTLAALVVAVATASLHAQTTIVNYSTGGTNVPGYTGYFNTSDGWTGGGAFWEGQQGWTGNGAGSDSVEALTGFTPGGANDNSGTLGLYPSVDADNILERAFAPMSPLSYSNISVSFVAEFALSEVTLPNGNNDAFVFNLQSGGTSALQLFMQAPGASPGFDYTLSSNDGGPTVAQFDMSYDSVYRLAIELDGTNWSGTLYGVTDPSGARTISSLGSLTGGNLANFLTASDLNTLEVGWFLESNDPDDPGSLALIANEFTLLSTGDPVPEPDTWALLLSGAAVVATVAYRRRSARGTKLGA